MKPDRARTLALDVLVRIERQDAYANLVLPARLDRSRLPERDRAFVTELVAGLGAGYRKVECAAFDVAWDERGRRLRQYVTILRDLWRGESVTASDSTNSSARTPKIARCMIPPITTATILPGTDCHDD